MPQRPAARPIRKTDCHNSNVRRTHARCHGLSSLRVHWHWRFHFRVSRPTLSATNADKDGPPFVFVIQSWLFDSSRMLAGAGGLGFLHQTAGVGDEVGYFEGFYQAGHAFVLEEVAHVGLG